MAISRRTIGNRIARQSRRVNRLHQWIAITTTVTGLLTGGAVRAQPAAPLSPQPLALPALVGAETSVTLTAASGETNRFLTQNGQTIDGNLPQVLEIPHLVLRRNGRLTAAKERSLSVIVSGLEIEQPTAMLSLELATVHPDPDAGDNATPIVVQRRTSQAADTAVIFTLTFEDTFGGSATPRATPTDYYSLTLTIGHDDGHDSTMSLPVALLLESQWVVELPAASEETAGAAPDSLVIYYSDMVPFQRVAGELNTRLTRSEIEDFVGVVLAPSIVEAFRLQSNEWGFTWHEAWTGYRGGDDAERLSVALTDGATWFHGAAFKGASSSISINVNGGLSGSYATLADGIVSVFHHELFHNLQRDLRQTLAGHADVDGSADAWAFITEGMAVAVQSIARPDLEYSAESETRTFHSWSNTFLHGTGRADNGLNTSYTTLNPYEGALYWRFLFEAAGGLDDPAAGMTVLRNVLEVLYSGEVVDMETSDDLVRYFPDIVSRGLAETPSSPFRTYRESLHSFARSIYAPRSGEAEGLYDPNHMFAPPAVESITYPPTFVRYDPKRFLAGHGISNSFGIDFVEIGLDTVVQKTPLVIEVRGATGSNAEFDVQILGFGAEGTVKIEQAASGSIIHTAYNSTWVTNLTLNEAGEELTGVVVIVVRVDNREKLDDEGRYALRVYPAATAS